MTKKHFEAIAEILGTLDADAVVVNTLSSYFETTNDNYDHERFVARVDENRK